MAGAEYDIWRAFDRAWAGNARRPPFTNDFTGNFIILLLIAGSTMIAGSLAALWVYGERADSGWDRGLWSGFVQGLSLVFVTMLLVFVSVPLFSMVIHPAMGIGLFTMAFTQLALPLATAAAVGTAIFVFFNAKVDRAVPS